jgi:hypothetical protein
VKSPTVAGVVNVTAGRQRLHLERGSWLGLREITDCSGTSVEELILLIDRERRWVPLGFAIRRYVAEKL